MFGKPELEPVDEGGGVLEFAGLGKLQVARYRLDQQIRRMCLGGVKEFVQAMPRVTRADLSFEFNILGPKPFGLGVRWVDVRWNRGLVSDLRLR